MKEVTVTSQALKALTMLEDAGSHQQGNDLAQAAGTGQSTLVLTDVRAPAKIICYFVK